MADDLNDFADPAKLKEFFEEVEEDFENLHGLFRDAHAANDALRIALMAILSALDDKLPAVRDIVVQALDESIEKASNPATDALPEGSLEAEIDALIDLRTRIDLSKELAGAK